MKVALIIILTSLAVIVAVTLLNFATYNGNSKINSKTNDRN